MRAPILTVLVLAGAALAGCVNNPLSGASLDDPLAKATEFDTSRAWSMPLSPALYELLDGVEVEVPSFDQTPISMGLFFPKIDGCDWSAASLPDSCKLPVVMDAGPYYADHVDRDKYRPPIIEWLVPRGYAVIQMSVRGTGESGGCMEFLSVNEQKDVDAMVTWAGTQPWSTGNVGMMGRSYDGTTPLAPAAMGNSYLKTIVPISSVPDFGSLMFKNGTSEFRGPIMHSYVYWFNYGWGMADGGAFGYRAGEWSSMACPEFVTGAHAGPTSTLTGDAGAQYWKDREFRSRIIENYKGSIWIVHGFEDWNVNPSQVVPWFNQLQDAGLEAKLWMGVWGHHYPDRADEHRNVRWDWAEQTVNWFDKHLKGKDVDTGPAVEVEDSLYVWRAEESYPPRDSVDRIFELSANGALAKESEGAAGKEILAGDTGLASFDVPPSLTIRWTSEPLESSLRIAGLPKLHVTVTPTTPDGGWLFAELYDVYPDNRVARIGWAAIDLNHHKGGNGGGEPLTPGQPVQALMEFEPMDAHVARGHRLQVVMHRAGVEDILPSPSLEPLTINLGAVSQLKLPEIQRDNLLITYSPPQVTE